MSKTVSPPAESTPKSNRDASANKQKNPSPYPPVEPTVAQRKSEQKDR